MKLVKSSSGKNKIKMSQKEWQAIGKKAGWVKEAIGGGLWTDKNQVEYEEDDMWGDKEQEESQGKSVVEILDFLLGKEVYLIIDFEYKHGEEPPDQKKAFGPLGKSGDKYYILQAAEVDEDFYFSPGECTISVAGTFKIHVERDI